MTDAKKVVIRREFDGAVALPRQSGLFRERGFFDAIQVQQQTARCRDRGFAVAVLIAGHEYVALTPPVLILGPVAVPGPTTCQITWETDIPAYHRVRYRKRGTSVWTTTAWTTTPNVNADILLSGL